MQAIITKTCFSPKLVGRIVMFDYPCPWDNGKKWKKFSQVGPVLEVAHSGNGIRVQRKYDGRATWYTSDKIIGEVTILK